MTDFDVQIPTYADDAPLGDGLVRIQWLNGQPKDRNGGKFFVQSDRLPDGFTPGDPWQPVTHVFESGDEAEGYEAETLGMIVITHRSQPFLEDREDNRTWLDRWQKGAEGQSMQAEVLIIADGLEELGPVVWNSVRVKTSFAIIAAGRGGDPAGIIPRIKAEVVKPASDAARRPLDTYCFRVEVGTERDAKGKVVYTEAGSRKVTRPVLLLPDSPSIETIRGMWVGKAKIESLIPIREQYEEWRKERKTNEAAEAQPVAAAGRNVPQEMSEEDELFAS